MKIFLSVGLESKILWLILPWKKISDLVKLKELRRKYKFELFQIFCKRGSFLWLHFSNKILELILLDQFSVAFQLILIITTPILRLWTRSIFLNNKIKLFLSWFHDQICEKLRINLDVNVSKRWSHAHNVFDKAFMLIKDHDQILSFNFLEW